MEIYLEQKQKMIIQQIYKILVSENNESFLYGLIVFIPRKKRSYQQIKNIIEIDVI